MTKSNASDDLKRWKDKYFTLQEKHDADQNEAEAFRTTLQRLLLRVCMSAEGQSAQFDKQLQQVRDDIKNVAITPEQLAKRLDQLNKALAMLDDIKDQHGNDYASVLAQMIDELLDLKPPRSEKGALKKLAKLVNKGTIRSERFIPLLQDYSEVQTTVLKAVSDNLPESEGLMSRLFGGSKDTSVKKDEPDNDASGFSEDELALEGEPETNVNPDQIPGFSAISARVSATLNHLLTQLSFPSSSQRALDALQEKIKQPLNWYEIGPTLDDVANIVISAIGKGQKDFNRFLSDVDGRLQKLQSAVLGVLKVGDTLREEERRMGEAVRTQMGNISLSLETENDIESLKSSIQTQMDSISDVLSHFSSASRKAEVSQQKELEVMTERFQALEEQAVYFRQQLKEERSKALTDALTQLPNREAYDDRFALEYERWKRYKKPATFVVADVDHFKRINDEYGHSSGDKVLQILAKEMQARLRKTDFIARYGGEEFVLILPETNIEVAQEVMNKTREKVSVLPFHFKDERVQVTLSFGLAEFTEGWDQETLFDKADKALYAAKNGGRNRVEVAS